jgi:hypothetical protein
MGVSVKESADPIGFFGTGLKFAIATVLRLGGWIEIHLDGVKHPITTQETIIRGRTFFQVLLDGEPLGFTTELGKTWEPWMAVRELFSNARDEGGITYVSETPETWAKGTSIFLFGEAFLAVWEDKERYFLQDSAPLVASRYCNIHGFLGFNSVFYKGIRIHQTNAPSIFCYDLVRNVDLTEDRTLKYDFQLLDAICRTLATCDNEDVIERALVPNSQAWECRLDFDIHESPSPAFRKVCQRLAKQKPVGFNARAIAFYRKTTGDAPDLEDAKITAVQAQMLAKAKAFVGSLGYEKELSEMPIRVVDWIAEGTLGQAHKGQILLAKPIFDHGTKYVASTLLEEFVHNRTGFNDETRQLQNWLFDKIVSMGEEAMGEPL